MQNLIVVIIVGLAAVYVARTFFGKKKTVGACGCGCTTCDASAACAGSSPDPRIPARPPPEKPD
ncbi:MAG: FeoB-associated Cys-rich membrane protein [Desulfobacterales bacterium]|nr:FeoB-associated Cys-rich membrane protein [Desulfobacterales bacterium]